MTVDSIKSLCSVMASPRILSLTAIAAGGLGLCIIIASQFLVSYSINSTFHGYLVGVGHLRVRDVGLVPPNGNYTRVSNQGQESFEDRNRDLVNYQSELLNGLAFAPLTSLDETQDARISNSFVYPDEISPRVYNDAPASLNLTLGDPPLPSSEKFGKADWSKYFSLFILFPLLPLFWLETDLVQ